jgi:hypothetical protein
VTLRDADGLVATGRTRKSDSTDEFRLLKHGLDFWKLNDLIDALYVIVDCHLRAKKSQAADCGHRDLAARPELFRARRGAR